MWLPSTVTTAEKWRKATFTVRLRTKAYGQMLPLQELLVQIQMQNGIPRQLGHLPLQIDVSLR